MRSILHCSSHDETKASIYQTLIVKLPVACLLLTLQLVFSPWVQAATGDEAWSDQFALEGLDGAVKAIVSDGLGNSYVGGDFAYADGLEVNHIAKWDGSRWSALGSGLELGAEVNALAYDNGKLYVGGSFANLFGDANADGILKWDGSSWSTLGSGLDTRVSALVHDGDSLYAGGFFRDADGHANADYIAKWDGSSWAALGSGLNNEVRALALDGAGVLYVGGQFTDAGGDVAADRVARWDGSSWSSLGPGFDDDVYALVYDGNSLYAGGTFSDAGDDINVDNIAKWDGVSWSALGSGFAGDVYALAYESGNLYVGGGLYGLVDQSEADNLAKWDGSHWSDLDSELSVNTSVFALQHDGNTLYAGGNFTSIDGSVKTHDIARWDEVSWLGMTGPVTATNKGFDGLNGTINAIVSDNAGNWYVGGEFTNAGGNANADYVARWDGSSWSALGLGLSNTVYALAYDGNSLYAGGQSTEPGGGQADVSGIAKWDGSSWSALGSGLNNRVYALALHGSDLYAGGTFLDAGGDSNADRIARWDGSSWSALGSPLNNAVYALVVDSSGALYAGGFFENAGGNLDADYVVKWDGSDWSALDRGLSNSVYALVHDGFNLYAAGYFTNAYGDINADRIAKWDGSSWSALGLGLSLTTRALAHDGNNLYAGSAFKNANGVKMTNGLSKWDGTNWSALGSGVSADLFGVVRALAFDRDGGLMVGGTLDRAGTKPSSNIAHWRQPQIVSPAPGSVLIDAGEKFAWSPVGADVIEWRFELTDVTTGASLYRITGLGRTTLSATVNGLPADGRELSAVLSYQLQGDSTWYGVTVNYPAKPLSSVITYPPEGSTFAGLSETFQWTPVDSATTYRVWLGSTPQGDDYGRYGSPDTSRTINDLPSDGGAVYATLKWNDGVWHTEPSIEYVAAILDLPKIESPLEGSTFRGASETFSWSTITGATLYRLWFGSTPGGDDYGRYASVGTSKVVTGLPVDGSRVYVTLKWFDTAWHTMEPVAYNASSVVPVIYSPVPGSTISGGTTSFQWNPRATASQYRVWLGSTAGGDELGRFASTGTSRVVSGLPVDGSTIYATLKWYDGIWHTEPSLSYETSP